MADGPFIFGQVRLDDDGLIDESIACLHCGFDLRGQTPDADCPHCRKPIDDSIRGDLLRFQSPAWLNMISLGLLIVVVGVVVALGVGLTKLLIWSEVISFNAIPGMVWVALMQLPIVVTAGGLWLVASRQPLDFGEEPPWSVRRLAQWAAATAAGLAILMFLAQGFTSKWGLIHGLRTMVRLPWQFIIHVAWLVAVAAGFYLAGSLAQRSPDLRLARLMRWAAIGVTAALALVYLHMVLTPVIEVKFRPAHTLSDDELVGVYRTLFYFGYALSILTVPFALGTIVLAVWLLRRVRAAAQRYAALD